MEGIPPDGILEEINEKISQKPAKPNPKWYGELSRLLAFAPLRLISEKPRADKEGHTYLIFRLPLPGEIADLDYSQYSIQEHANTLLELKSGAIIQYPKGQTLWSFSLGSIYNLIQERDPYRHTDRRIWGWPKTPPKKEEILLHSPKESGLPEEIQEVITNFLKEVQPPINKWGIATCPSKKAMAFFIIPSLPPKQANPEPILNYLRWFTPHHYHWTCIEDPQNA